MKTRFRTHSTERTNAKACPRQEYVCMTRVRTEKLLDLMIRTENFLYQMCDTLRRLRLILASSDNSHDKFNTTLSFLINGKHNAINPFICLTRNYGRIFRFGRRFLLRSCALVSRSLHLAENIVRSSTWVFVGFRIMSSTEPH